MSSEQDGQQQQPPPPAQASQPPPPLPPPQQTEQSSQPEPPQRSQQQQPSNQPQSDPAAAAPSSDDNINEEAEAEAEEPLLEKHTQLAPGPRATRLRQLFQTTLNHTLDKLRRKEHFASCYPTIASRAPGTLEFVQRQMVDRLGSQCEREFESIIGARDVVRKLNELEGLVADAGGRRKESNGGARAIPPHLLPPDSILSAHLNPHLVSTQSQLNAKLQNVQAQNATLFSEIQQQRAEIEGLLGMLDQMLGDVAGATGLLDPIVGELVRESEEVSTTAGGGGGGGGEDVQMGDA